MQPLYRHILALTLAAIAGCLTTPAARGDDDASDSETILAPVVDAEGYEFDDALYDEEVEFFQTQTQPPAAEEPPARRPPRGSTAVRRRQRTYRLPPMFGDIFGGGTFQAVFQPPQQTIMQSLTDGVGGFQFFVINANGGNGADPDPAVAISVQDLTQGGLVIAQSNGPGVGTLGQPSTYPITEPAIPGVSPPVLTGGVIAYNGGTVSYAGQQAPVGNGDNWRLDFSHTFTPNPVLINVPLGGSNVGREKISENNSPEPRARFFWNYNFFNDVNVGLGDVNRNSFGFEQPTSNGIFSVAFRFPFAGTLDVDQVLGTMGARNTQFGDVTVIGKVALWRYNDFLLSLGTGVTVPTAKDARLFSNPQTQVMQLNHQAVRLLPYLAMMQSNDTGWYWQSFVQLDIAANGDPLLFDASGANLTRIGVLQEPTALFVDFGVGRWIMGDPGQGAPAVAATAELHYSGTLQDADTVMSNDLAVTSIVNRYDRLQLTAGLNVALTSGISIRPAMVVPLTQNDQLMDYEAMVQMNVWR